jgi:hypothetical protein
MKLQESKPLATVYSREEAFSSDLANHLGALGVGSFEDAETESNVGSHMLLTMMILPQKSLLK